MARDHQDLIPSRRLFLAVLLDIMPLAVEAAVDGDPTTETTVPKFWGDFLRAT